jgi:hypothetical protein
MLQRSGVRNDFYTCPADPIHRTACSVGWWLMAGTGLF